MGKKALNAKTIKDQAYRHWGDILYRLGVDSCYLVKGVHTACPICGGKDRYRFDDKTPNLTYYCNHCGHGSGLDMLMKLEGIGLHEALTKVDDVLSGTHSSVDTIASIKTSLTEPVSKAKKKILEGLIKFTSRTPTQAGIEYWDSRGIKGMGGRRIENVQYGAIAYGVYGTIKDEGRYVKTDAVVGLLSRWGEDPIGAVQIYLEPEKIAPYIPNDKEYISKPLIKNANLAGSGVWFAGTAKSKILHVAEGLENAMSIASMLNTRHVVATVTAPLMRSLFIPDHVTTVHIWRDDDKAGIDASKKLKERYPAKKTRIKNPNKSRNSKDWNDLLKKLILP